MIPIEPKDKFNFILKSSLEGKQGSEDIEIDGQINTVSYQPVVIGTDQMSWNAKINYFMTVFIASPRFLTNNVNSPIDQQKNSSIIVVAVISALSLGIASLVIT
jgi:hypothetical protein